MALIRQLFPLVLTTFFPFIQSFSQDKFAFDHNEQKVYFENIIEFGENFTKGEINKAVDKFLRINEMPILYGDSSEIHSIGGFETKYKRIFPVGYNTIPYNVIFNIEFSFKDGRMKYYATNYFLIPKEVTISSRTWGGGFLSTSKIPTEIPKKAIEPYYLDGKTTEKHLLFPELERKMFDFQNTLEKFIRKEKEDW